MKLEAEERLDGMKKMGAFRWTKRSRMKTEIRPLNPWIF